MSQSRRLSLLALFALLGALIFASVGQGSPAGGAGNGPSGLAHAIAAQESHSARLLARPVVVGTAVGAADGTASIKVLTRRSGARVAKRLGNVPVEVVVTGPLNALHHRPGHSGGPSGGDDDGGNDGGATGPPTGFFNRPVPIGVSTGNAKECAAGTIGARVKGSDGAVYALSNNHVYARENAAAIGEEVLQPGRYDTGCAYDPSNRLGELSSFAPIAFGGSPNKIDAAIASTDIGKLGNSTPAGGYGTPGSTPVAASLGLAVQKFGRTTSLTHGTVTGINGQVQVGFGAGTALFVDQVFVESRKPGFIKSGDSGSLLVTDPSTGPVGLLFAGNANGKFAVANKIGHVLAEFNVTVDGE